MRVSVNPPERLQVGDWVKATHLNGQVISGRVTALHVHKGVGITAYRVDSAAGSEWFAASNVKRIAIDGARR